MSLRNLALRGSRYLTDNSPAIMTAVGVVSVVGVGVLTGKATFKASELIFEENQRRTDSAGVGDNEVVYLDKTDTFKLLWKLYMPAVGVGALGITCIIMSNRVSARRAAAVAMAYAALDGDFQDYKDKVAEKLSPTKRKELEQELAADKVNKSRGRAELPIPGEGLVLLHDAYSDRFFAGTVENVRSAINDITATVLTDDHATVSDFYTLIGLRHTQFSSESGWNAENKPILEWNTVPGANDGDPAAHSFSFGTHPTFHPWKRKSSQ